MTPKIILTLCMYTTVLSGIFLLRGPSNLKLVE